MPHLDGSSHVSSATAADIPSSTWAPTIHREGRQPMRTGATSGIRRDGADPVDEPGEFGIGGHLVTHEPVPELIVLDFQQA